MAIKINLMPRKEDSVMQEEEKHPFYFLIAFFVFIFSFLVFAGIYSYSNFFLKKQLSDTEKESIRFQEEISKSVTPEELPVVISAIVKGRNIQSMLSSHLYSSNTYAFLKGITIKSVTYNNFFNKINADNTVSVSVSGEADSFNALAKQLVVYKKSKEIKNVVLDGGETNKGAKVFFSAELLLDSELVIAAAK